MLRIPRYLEYIFICIALWFFIGNPVNLLVNGASGGQIVDVSARRSNSLLPILSMGIFAISSAILFFRWKFILTRLRANPQFLLLIGFLFVISISSLWSFYPSITSRRSILFLGSTTLAVLFSLGFTFKQQLRFLIIALCVNVLLCFIFGLLIPQYGVMSAPHTGAWRGVYTHKNKLGAQMALTTGVLLVTQYTHLFKDRALLATRFFMVLSFFMVVASTSTNGLITTIAIILTFVVCNALKLNYRAMVIAVSSIIFITSSFSLYMQANADVIFGLFGKGSDLTGRDDIWPALWHMVSQKPLLGYGYKGFWGPFGGPADFVRQIAGWPVPNAHNGFIEIFLAVGWIGAILFFSNFLITTVKSLQMVRLTKENYSIFPVIFLVFMVLSNLTESNLFQFDTWILYVWASLSPLQVAATYFESQSESLDKLEFRSSGYFS